MEHYYTVYYSKKWEIVVHFKILWEEEGVYVKYEEEFFKKFLYIHLRKEDWWKLGQIFHSFRSVAPGPKNSSRQAIELQFLLNMNLNLHCTKNLAYLLAIFCVNT